MNYDACCIALNKIILEIKEINNFIAKVLIAQVFRAINLFFKGMYDFP